MRSGGVKAPPVFFKIFAFVQRKFVSYSKILSKKRISGTGEIKADGARYKDRK